MIMAVF